MLTLWSLLTPWGRESGIYYQGANFFASAVLFQSYRSDRRLSARSGCGLNVDRSLMKIMGRLGYGAHYLMNW